jgi:aminopeptidase-like protein
MDKDELFSWIEDLYPINRSIVGKDYDSSLNYLTSKLNCDFRVIDFRTGERSGSWTVPKGWTVKSGYIKRLNGELLLDFKNSNLHIWSHSQPISGTISLDELIPHLASVPESPSAIPYRTTYYQSNWGFSIADEVLKTMNDEFYEIRIDSDFYDHTMKVLEIVIPGKFSQEILFSSYLCHPSMVNNELSGPTLLIALANLVKQKDRLYTYRFLLAPETIGPIFYLKEMHQMLSEKVVMGWNLTCVGDPGAWSFLHTQKSDSIVDLVSLGMLNSKKKSFKCYSFLERGSDERQFSSPQVAIPMASIMRSKYTEYPEYHTSLDNLDLVTPQSLFETYEFYSCLIDYLDFEGCYFSTSIGEPFLMSYFNRKKLGGEFLGYAQDLAAQVNNFVAYSNGRSLVNIAATLNLDLEAAKNIAAVALEHQLVDLKPHRIELTS